MTLTEEQREAIRVISKLPMAIGCQLCHPYIMENYGSHFIVLRDMIDSSEHVTDHTKMIGFDLERARAICEAATKADFIFQDEQPDGDEDGWDGGYYKTGEILIIRDKNDDDAAPESIGQLDRQGDAEFFCQTITLFPDAIAEIERLRAEISEQKGMIWKTQQVKKEQAAQIKELEEVLVEMVATNPCNIPTLCDVVHDELMCPALDGNCDFWKGCPQKNELREAARKQLQAEGKIGNGDHIAETDQMVPCWQITEERKAAIGRAIESVVAADSDSEEQESEDVYTWRVLRDMLEEAE